MTGNKKTIGKQVKDWCERHNYHCHYTPETTSTNDLAKAESIKNDFDLRVYVTDFQTHGRGRGVRTWETSRVGQDLLSTWSLRLKTPPQHISGPLVGLALFQCVCKTWPQLRWALKAPNDLLLNGYKTAGLLIESVSQAHSHCLIIGLGFNLYSHPQHLADATHLNSEDGLANSLTNADLENFLNNWVQALSNVSVLCQETEIHEENLRRLKEALNKNPNLKASVSKVTKDAGLIFPDHTISWMDL